MLWIRTCDLRLRQLSNIHAWYSVEKTPWRLSNSFQESNLLAMEFFGCSKEKYLPARWDAIQSSAAISAIWVSRSSLRRFEGGSSKTTEGIPLGLSSSLRGFGEKATPTIGLSLALEKVEQFGAQCLIKLSSKDFLRALPSLKTSRPLNKSQGSATFLLTLRACCADSPVKNPPGAMVATAPGRRCPYLPSRPSLPSFEGRLLAAFLALAWASLAFFLSFCSLRHSGGKAHRGSWRFLHTRQ